MTRRSAQKRVHRWLSVRHFGTRSFGMRGYQHSIGKLAFAGVLPTVLVGLVLEISGVGRPWMIVAVVTSMMATVLIGYRLSRWK